MATSFDKKGSDDKICLGPPGSGGSNEPDFFPNAFGGMSSLYATTPGGWPLTGPENWGAAAVEVTLGTDDFCVECWYRRKWGVGVAPPGYDGQWVAGIWRAPAGGAGVGSRATI